MNEPTNTMNTTKPTTKPPRKRRPGGTYKPRYWAIRVQTVNGPKWRAYMNRSQKVAMDAAERRADCTRILEVRELDQNQFNRLYAQSDQQTPCHSAAPKLTTGRPQKQKHQTQTQP